MIGQWHGNRPVFDVGVDAAFSETSSNVKQQPFSSAKQESSTFRASCSSQAFGITRWVLEKQPDPHKPNAIKLHTRKHRRKPTGVFTLGDTRSFFRLTSKAPPLGQMLNFDAHVKTTTARHQNRFFTTQHPHLRRELPGPSRLPEPQARIRTRC